MIQVEVLKEAVNIDSWDGLARLIQSESAKGKSCIWLRSESGSQLALMLNHRVGYPHYFPEDSDHPGFQLHPKPNADWEREVDFIADNREPTPMTAALTTNLDEILKIAEEYFSTDGALPTGVDWSEL